MPSRADWLFADRGNDADWFRGAVKGGRGPIPGRKSRGKPIKYDERRSRIEIMFGGFKDWRRVATRSDRCPKVFLAAVTLGATVMLWLLKLTSLEHGQPEGTCSVLMRLDDCDGIRSDLDGCLISGDRLPPAPERNHSGSSTSWLAPDPNTPLTSRDSS